MAQPIRKTRGSIPHPSPGALSTRAAAGARRSAPQNSPGSVLPDGSRAHRYFRAGEPLTPLVELLRSPDRKSKLEKKKRAGRAEKKTGGVPGATFFVLVFLDHPDARRGHANGVAATASVIVFVRESSRK